MKKYETRPSGNYYYPWMVVDVETGKPESTSHYGSEESAQRIADQRNAGISAEEAYDDFFSEMMQWDEEAQTLAQRDGEKPAPQEETEFISGMEHHIGDEIADNDGNIYIAIQPSYYISLADAADFEDGWDAQVTVGWHTPARLKSQSQRDQVRSK